MYFAWLRACVFSSEFISLVYRVNSFVYSTAAKVDQDSDELPLHVVPQRQDALFEPRQTSVGADSFGKP